MLILLINTFLPWKKRGKSHKEDPHNLPVPPFKWSRSLLFLVQKLFQCIQQEPKTFMSKIVNPAGKKNVFNYFLIKCRTCKAISVTACASLHRLYSGSHFPKDLISHEGKQFQQVQAAESHRERWGDGADSCKHFPAPGPGCWEHSSPVSKHEHNHSGSQKTPKPTSLLLSKNSMFLLNIFRRAMTP